MNPNIRAQALEFAAGTLPSGSSAQKLVEAAKAFEHYIIYGEMPKETTGVGGSLPALPK